MLFFDALLVCFGTYSSLPVPSPAWNERTVRYALCFFPAVGLLCGGALWGWWFLAARLSVSGGLFAAVGTCLPLLLTGGIHMDGYLDTVDALASHQSRARRLEILKDPRCGAFAVIYGGVYLLLYAGLLCELFQTGGLPVLCPVFPLSRSLSGLEALTLPGAREGGMLRAYTDHAGRRVTLSALLVSALCSGAACLALSPRAGGGAVLLALLWFLAYRKLTARWFGGVTGDTAGFFLQVCELLCLLGLWLGGMLP